MYIYIYLYIYIYRYINISLCAYAYVYVFMYDIYIYIYVHVYVCLDGWLVGQMHACMHACITCMSSNIPMEWYLWPGLLGPCPFGEISSDCFEPRNCPPLGMLHAKLDG